MKKTIVSVVSAVGGLLALPSVAYAAPVSAASLGIKVGISLVGLLVAAFLLSEALRIRKVMAGGAVADKISLVVLATICLAASALASWAEIFVSPLMRELLMMVAQALVIVAMGLMAAYFYAVRTALQSYLTALTGSEQLAIEIAERSAADEEN